MSIKRKLILSIVFVMVTAGLIVYLIILPTASDIKKIKNDIYKEKTDLEKKYLRGQLLKKILKNYEQTKDRQHLLNEIFIVSGEELKFVTALEQLAQKYSLTQEIKLSKPVAEIKPATKGKIPEKETIPKDFFFMPLELITTGEYANQLKYLGELEQMGYYIKFSQLSFQSKEDGVVMTLKGEVSAAEAKMFLQP